MMMRSVLQEDTIILNLYALDNNVKTREAKTDGITMRNRQIHFFSADFNTFHSVTDRSIYFKYSYPVIPPITYLVSMRYYTSLTT